MEPPVPLWPLTGIFLRLANFTFGGGSATVGALQRELVVRRHWLRADQFALCYALARATPGTNLLAFCTAVGWLLRGSRGAAAVLLAASIPSCALVWFVTAGFDAWQKQRWLQLAIDGALAASVGILLASFWQLIQPSLTKARWPQVLVFTGGSLALSFGAHLSPLSILFLAAIGGYYWPVRREA